MENLQFRGWMGPVGGAAVGLLFGLKMSDEMDNELAVIVGGAVVGAILGALLWLAEGVTRGWSNRAVQASRFGAVANSEATEQSGSPLILLVLLLLSTLLFWTPILGLLLCSGALILQRFSSAPAWTRAALKVLFALSVVAQCFFVYAIFTPTN